MKPLGLNIKIPSSTVKISQNKVQDKQNLKILSKKLLTKKKHDLVQHSDNCINVIFKKW